MRTSLAPSLFDPDRFTIRTPKRPGGYAAQVWGERGFWLLGVFATIPEARTAARLFLATDPAEPDPHLPRSELPANWVRRRSDSHAPRYNCVRRVKGGAWQARPWLGNGRGSLNLGLFTVEAHGEYAEWAAARVSRAFNREWKGARTVAEVVDLLKAAPNKHERVPAHVQVPEHQRALRPPVAAPAETAEERRARENLERMERRSARYGHRTLFDLVAA